MHSRIRWQLGLCVAALLALFAAWGCESLPFIGEDAEPGVSSVEVFEEHGVPEVSAIADLEEVFPPQPEVIEEKAPAVLLRVFRAQSGHIEALFDQPVRVVGGEVKLVSDKGALGRKVLPDSEEYSYSLMFDVNSLEEGGQVVATAIKSVDGGHIVSEDGTAAIVEFSPQSFVVERRLFGTSVAGARPYVREVRAEEWSVRIYFSTSVRFSENLRLLARNTENQMGEMRLAWESLNAMRNWSFVDNLLFEVPESFRGETFWISPVQVYGFSEGDALSDAGESGLPARRGLQPFSVDLSRGAILNDLQRCAYYLADGDQMRYSFAVSNLGEFIQGSSEMDGAMVRSECMKAISRMSVGSDAGLSRNWKYSVCMDSLESEYRMSEFYPGDMSMGHPAELRDRWLRADELVSRPYDLLTLDERMELRKVLTHESCPAFYPQLFYGYWMEAE